MSIRKLNDRINIEGYILIRIINSDGETIGKNLFFDSVYCVSDLYKDTEIVYMYPEMYNGVPVIVFEMEGENND